MTSSEELVWAPCGRVKELAGVDLAHWRLLKAKIPIGGLLQQEDSTTGIAGSGLCVDAGRTVVYVLLPAVVGVDVSVDGPCRGGSERGFLVRTVVTIGSRIAGGSGTGCFNLGAVSM